MRSFIFVGLHHLRGSDWIKLMTANYLENVWGAGQLLACSGIDSKTDYKAGLVGRTSFCGAGLTIEIPGRCELFFSDTVPVETSLGSDFFVLDLGSEKVQGVFLDAYHLLIDGPCKTGQVPEELELVKDGSRTLLASKPFLDVNMMNSDIGSAISIKRKWFEQIRLPLDIPPVTRKTLCKALSQMKGQVCTPEGTITHRWTTPDRWPHRGLWIWDSVFHAIGLRHIDPVLAREIIIAVLDNQRKDGYVPMWVTPYEDPTRMTQPPVLCLGVHLIQSVNSDKEWLREIYPALVKYVEYDLNSYDTDGFGLVSWDNYLSGPTRPSNASGMDNSPRFDDTFDFKAVDFNSYLALECELLAEFASLLGFYDDQKKFKGLHKNVCQKINNYMWNSEAGLYVDYDKKTAKQSQILASSAFLPLICGAASDEQVDAMIQHLQNPQTFGTKLPVPSVARNSNCYVLDMWRGPVWVNINWLIAYGLDRYGKTEVANEITQKTISTIEKYYLNLGSIFEYYDPDDNLKPPELMRKGKLAPEESPYHQVIFDYGWSGALYVDMVYGIYRNNRA